MTARAISFAALGALFMAMLAGPDVRGQSVVSDISQHEIELEHSFEGLSLLIFGAIDHRSESGHAGPFEVIVLLRGPAEDIVVRRKERTGGIWVNRSAQFFDDVPGYLAIAASAPLDEIADAEVRSKLGLGLVLDSEGDEGDAVRAEFVAGLMRVQTRAGLFTSDVVPLEVNSDTLFQARFLLPSHTPVGRYKAEAILFEGGRQVSRSTTIIQVRQAGFVLAVSSLAKRSPAIYGILAVLVALFAGWVAGFVGRR